MKFKLFILIIFSFYFNVNAQKIVGYIPQYRTIEWMDTYTDWSKMTEAYYFGSVPTGAGGITIEQPARFQHVLDRAAEHEINPWLSVGGWGKSGNFITIANSASNRQAFAKEALRLCQLHELTGIDIDWEFPAAGQEAAFRDFFKTLYETLNPAGYLVSAACGGEAAHADKWLAETFTYIDDLNIMSYDAPTGVASNHASLDFMIDAMDIYYAQGCPYSKMLGGVAFYSRPTVKMYSEILNGSNDKQSIFENDGSNSVKYNGKTTIEEKIDYVMAKGGIGILIWEVTQDVIGEYSLLDACYTKMEEYMCPLPKPDLGIEQSICGSASVTLDAGVTGSISYKWYKNDVLIPSATSKTYAATSADSYKVEVTDGTCSNFAKVEVLGVLPLVELGESINLCSPATASLDVGLTGSGISFLWKKDNQIIDGESSKDLLVRASGIYEITVSATGCGSTTDEVTVTSSLLTVKGGIGCTNDDITLEVIDGNGPYEWFSSSLSSNPEAEGDTYTSTFPATTSMYVWKKETFTGQIVTPGANTYSNSSTTTHYNNQVLRLESEMKLNSMKFRTGASGAWIEVRLYGPDGATVKEEAFNVNNSQEIDWEINETLAAGDYKLNVYIRSGQVYFSTRSTEYSTSGVAVLYPEKDHNQSPTGRFGLFYDVLVTAGYKNTCDKTPVIAEINSGCSSSPSISMSANKNSVCQGVNISFTALATDAGVAPLLVWKVNGVQKQSSTSLTYSSSTLSNSDVVEVSLLDDQRIKSEISMSIKVLPSKPVITGTSEYCAEESISLVTSSSSEGDYKWMKGGIIVSMDKSFEVSKAKLSDAGLYTTNVSITRDGVTCASRNSDPFTLNVSNSLTPSVSISESLKNICSGENVNFMATPVNGGTSPVYDWLLNNKSTVGSGAYYSSEDLNDGDVVSVVLKSSERCLTLETSSAAVTIVVKEQVSRVQSIPNQNLIHGFVDYQINLNDIFSGNNLTYETDKSSVIGISIAGEIATISDKEEGSELITIRSTDDCGYSAIATIQFNVAPEEVVVPVLTISSIEEGEILEGTGEVDVLAVITGLKGKTVDGIVFVLKNKESNETTSIDGNIYTMSMTWDFTVKAEYVIYAIASLSDGSSVNSIQVNFAVDVTTEVNFIEGVREVAVYPNPFNDNVTVQIDVVQSQQAEVTVYNVIGSRMTTENVSLSQGVNELNFQTSQWGNGMYIVMIKSSRGVYSLKIEK